jgi:biotin carboxyl carrier protein
MNHVKADQSGRVAQILCKDGEWVEFEQPIIYLEPLGE